MRTVHMLATSALALLALPAGCIEPDLGDVPFFCNQGDPMCPEGYQCVASRCVREGVGPQDGGVVPPDGGATTDWSYWPGDAQQQSDTPPVKWDLGAALPDTYSPKLDTGSTYPSCVTNSDCTVDPLYPCCCLGVCELFCFFPLCF